MFTQTNNRPLGQTDTPPSIIFILALYLLSAKTEVSINNGMHDNKHSSHACTDSAARSKHATVCAVFILENMQKVLLPRLCILEGNTERSGKVYKGHRSDEVGIIP